MGNTCQAGSKEGKGRPDHSALPSMGIELEDRRLDGLPAALGLDLSRINDSDRTGLEETGPKGSMTVRDPKTGRRMKKPPKHALRGSMTARPARDPTGGPSAPPRQEDLPYGWDIAKTQEGKLYYFNTLTSQKQWNPPDGSNTGWNWDPKKEKDSGANSWAAY